MRAAPGSLSAMTSSHLVLMGLTRLSAVGLMTVITAAALLGIFAVHGGWQILTEPISTMPTVAPPDFQFTIRDAKSDRLSVQSEAPTTIAEKEPEPIVLDRRALINDAQIAALK
jgi:hypothetical protein